MAIRILESSVPWKTGAVLAGAILIGVAAFMVTSVTPQYTYLGPLCRMATVQDPGFDPWTGMPHGDTYGVSDCLELGDGKEHQVTSAPPADIADRRAIPIPLGTAIGLVILGSLALYTERRGRILTVGDGALR